MKTRYMALLCFCLTNGCFYDETRSVGVSTRGRPIAPGTAIGLGANLDECKTSHGCDAQQGTITDEYKCKNWTYFVSYRCRGMGCTIQTLDGEDVGRSVPASWRWVGPFDSSTRLRVLPDTVGSLTIETKLARNSDEIENSEITRSEPVIVAAPTRVEISIAWDYTRDNRCTFVDTDGSEAMIISLFAYLEDSEMSFVPDSVTANRPVGLRCGFHSDRESLSDLDYYVCYADLSNEPFTLTAVIGGVSSSFEITPAQETSLCGEQRPLFGR